MSGLLRLAVALVGVFWLAIAGAAGVWWWDRRPAHTPAIRVLLWRWEAPESLAARLAAIGAAEAAAARHASAAVAREAILTRDAAARATATQVQIRTVTREIVRRVPTTVTPAMDRRYPLSVGWVRVHDAAARGLELPAAGETAGRPDDAPSVVKPSRAAVVIAGNYGACRADQARLTALQDWITASRALELQP